MLLSNFPFDDHIVFNLLRITADPDNDLRIDCHGKYLLLKIEVEIVLVQECRRFELRFHTRDGDVWLANHSEDKTMLENRLGIDINASVLPLAAKKVALEYALEIEGEADEPEEWNEEDTEYWCEDTCNASVTADTTDAEINDLIDELETECYEASNGQLDYLTVLSLCRRIRDERRAERAQKNPVAVTFEADRRPIDFRRDKDNLIVSEPVPQTFQ